MGERPPIISQFISVSSASFISPKRDLIVAEKDPSYYVVKNEDINTIVSFKSMEQLDPNSSKVRAEVDLAKFSIKISRKRLRAEI